MSQGFPDRRRVIVVGGGVVGCAVAYCLAKSRFHVTLVERDAEGSHASAYNAGNLNPLFGTPTAFIPAALTAYHLHTKIRKELTDLGLPGCTALPVKRIHLGCDEADRVHLKEIIKLFNSIDGFSATWLENDDLRKIKPELAKDLSFAVLTSGGLSIDGHSFTCSLAEGARRFGATVIHEAATGVVTEGERVTAIRAGQEFISCDEVIFSTGPWVADVESWLGLRLDIKPVKGQILQLEAPKEMPQCDFAWRSTCLYRRNKNEVWLGTTIESCGLDEAPTREAREFLLKSAERIMLDIRSAKVLGHVAGLRPVSDTELPIAKRTDGWQNVYIANGAGSKGVLLSVGIAQEICDLLLRS